MDIAEVTDWDEGSPTPNTPPVEPAKAAETAAAVVVDAAVDPLDDDAEEADETGRDEHGRFRPRHRAESQKASAKDVPRIRELTKRLREAETQIAALKTSKPPAEPALEPPKAHQPSTYTVRMPVLDDFAKEEDPYLELAAAKAEWKIDKKQHEKAEADAQAKADTDAKNYEETGAKRLDGLMAAHTARMEALVKANPAHAETLKALNGAQSTPLLGAAILSSDKGAEFVLEFARHPLLLDEMILQTEGKAVTEASVAALQRILLARLQAAPTGSAETIAPRRPDPRPPNPVRTGPMKTGDTPPGDDDSLEAHAKYFGVGRRRR